MKTWIKGGLIGLSVGLVFGSWALFNYTLAGGSSQVWFEILIFSPIIKFVDNLTSYYPQKLIYFHNDEGNALLLELYVFIPYDS